MMQDSDAERMLEHVGRLPVLTPDSRRADRLRARWRARLAPPSPKKTRPVGPALFAGWCLLYLSAVIYDVLRLRAVL